jgi:pimeloyl-ACP methyl ester carboxylesterase
MRRLIVLLAVLALAGCGGSRTAGPTLELHGCSVQAFSAECGTLRVPVNPAQPHGKTIPLAVAVVHAKSLQPKPDPVFYFAGWGSAGATDDAPSVTSLFSQVLENRDVVFVDQRGTGSSELVCHFAAGANVTTEARGCALRIGPTLRYYTSTYAADDFDLVRRALGYDKINLYGGSYGVTLEQIYLLRHGSHVRSAVFDSGSLLDVHIFEQQPPFIQRALDRNLAACAADYACNATFPKVRSELPETLKRLARKPVFVTDLGRVDAPGVASAVEEVNAYSSGKPLVPRFIHLLATGRYADAVALAGIDTSQQSYELAYKLLIQCSEPWASWRPSAIARSASGTYVASAYAATVAHMRQVCAGFPKVGVPAAIGERVRSSAPVLIMMGGDDGADPPENVANAQRELPNSRTIVFPNAGHGQLGLPCAQTLVAEFYGADSARGLDAWCATTAVRREFDTRGS